MVTRRDPEGLDLRAVLDRQRIARLGRDRRLYLGWWRAVLAGGEIPDRIVISSAAPGSLALAVVTPFGHRSRPEATLIVVREPDGVRPHVYLPERFCTPAGLSAGRELRVVYGPTRVLLRRLS